MELHDIRNLNILLFINLQILERKYFQNYESVHIAQVHSQLSNDIITNRTKRILQRKMGRAQLLFFYLVLFFPLSHFKIKINPSDDSHIKLNNTTVRVPIDSCDTIL